MLTEQEITQALKRACTVGAEECAEGWRVWNGVDCEVKVNGESHKMGNQDRRNRDLSPEADVFLWDDEETGLAIEVTIWGKYS